VGCRVRLKTRHVHLASFDSDIAPVGVNGR
jgi:hypothetical protein